MGLNEYLEKISSDDLRLFKKCIRKLLDSTFIVNQKNNREDQELYDFLSYMSNREYVRMYLSFMGYDLVVEEQFKFAMLIQSESDEEIAGFKRLNHKKFNKKEISVFVILCSLFYAQFGKKEEVYVERGEVIAMLKQHNIHLSPAELRNALKEFRRFHLIDYVDSRQDYMSINLYPTLSLAMNKDQMECLIDNFLNDDVSVDEVNIEEDEYEQDFIN